MNQDSIEDLRLEIEQLKLVTNQLRRENDNLRTENQNLTERVDRIERSNLPSAIRTDNNNRIQTNRESVATINTLQEEISQSDLTRPIRIGEIGRQVSDFRPRDRIQVVNPTCPGRSHNIIEEDRYAVVTRTDRTWVHFICDSGVRTKRYPSNIILLRCHVGQN